VLTDAAVGGEPDPIHNAMLSEQLAHGSQRLHQIRF